MSVATAWNEYSTSWSTAVDAVSVMVGTSLTLFKLSLPPLPSDTHGDDDVADGDVDVAVLGHAVASVSPELMSVPCTANEYNTS